MAELITVPTFTFPQGDPFDIEIMSEYPIEVRYYRDTIELNQRGHSVLISNDYYKALFKEVQKHFAEAQTILK